MAKAGSNAVARILAGKDLAAPPSRKRDERGLTSRQRTFVGLLVSTDATPSKAYEEAYGTKGRAAETGASRTLRLPAIQAAIVDAARRVVAQGALPAAKRLTQLVDKAKSEYVRLDAAKHTLAIAGIAPRGDGLPPAGGAGVVLKITFAHVGQGNVSIGAEQGIIEGEAHVQSEEA